MYIYALICMYVMYVCLYVMYVWLFSPLGDCPTTKAMSLMCHHCSSVGHVSLCMQLDNKRDLKRYYSSNSWLDIDYCKNTRNAAEKD